MKLEEITNKVYAEGVEKGQAEAQQIIAKAKAEAAAIVAEAEKTAAANLAQAQAQMAELDKNTRAELRMFAEQSVNAIKTEVTNLINGKVVSSSVAAATADGKFMQQIMLTLATEMAKTGKVEIDAKQAAALRDYFAANAKQLLSEGVTINEVKGIKTDFQIKPANGGYKLAFGDQEFVAYFKEFLRPQLIELLFN